MDDQLTADYSTVDFATATNAITLTPQQSAAVQDAGRLNKNLLENFKDANMQGVAGRKQDATALVRCLSLWPSTILAYLDSTVSLTLT
jgi:hypothetical protein